MDSFIAAVIMTVLLAAGAYYVLRDHIQITADSAFSTTGARPGEVDLRSFQGRTGG